MSMTVLIIEDNSLFRRALERLIQAEGYHVLSFGSAEDALSSDTIDGYNVALLDLHLPGMWGDEFAEIVSRRGYPDTIAFVTSELDAGPRLRKRVPGCEVIKKPADVDLLLSFLHKASAKFDRTHARN